MELLPSKPDTDRTEPVIGKGVYGRTYKAIASNTITPSHQALTAVCKQQSEFSSCGLALTGTKLLFQITPGFIA